MRVLVIAAYMPWPLHAGNSIRLFHLAKGLAERGFKVHLLAGRAKDAECEPGPLASACEEIRLFETRNWGRTQTAIRSLGSLFPYPFQKFLTRELREGVRQYLKDYKFDAIVTNLVPLAMALPRQCRDECKVVLDEGESQSLVWKLVIKAGGAARSIFGVVNWMKVLLVERRAFKRASDIWCVSRAEAELRGRSPSVNVDVVPNGVDTDYFSPGKSASDTSPLILFLANMGIERNEDAARWFVESVFPRVKEQQPNAEFWIVGKNPSPAVLKMRAIEGVEVTGMVEDIRPYYERARMVVSPYRLGAGTKLKVLEAMSMARPLVGTDAGIQGIDVQDGVHFSLANDPSSMSEAVLRLLGDPARAAELGGAARDLALSRYSWNSILDRASERLGSTATARSVGS